MEYSWELKKCDGEACTRRVKASVAYCCDPCFLASSRGPHIDPWMP